MITAQECEAVHRRCQQVLGDPNDFKVPTGYPDSLALCVLDAIYSVSTRYAAVERLVQRYRQHRKSTGDDADSDGTPELIKVMAAAGGPARFASQVVNNRQRTSTHQGAPLKAEAVLAAATALVRLDVRTAQEFRHLHGAALDAAETAWRGVPGQRSGVTWRYLTILVGGQNVKPD